MEEAHVQKINLENALISYVAYVVFFYSRLGKKYWKHLTESATEYIGYIQSTPGGKMEKQEA